MCNQRMHVHCDELGKSTLWWLHAIDPMICRASWKGVVQHVMNKRSCVAVICLSLWCAQLWAVMLSLKRHVLRSILRRIWIRASSITLWKCSHTNSFTRSGFCVIHMWTRDGPAVGKRTPWGLTILDRMSELWHSFLLRITCHVEQACVFPPWSWSL